MQCSIEVISLLKHIAGIGKCFCNYCIKNYIRLTDRVLGTYHSELEFIPGESERRSTVTVCRILHEFRKGPDSCRASRAVGSLPGAHELIEYVCQLVSEIYGDDSRWCFIGSETGIIAYICSRLTEQICMLIYCLQDAAEHKQELHILMRSLARVEEILTIIGHK